MGGGAPLDYYTTTAREHGVEDNVFFSGHREDIPEIIRALDLVVIPSTKHEGIPQIGLQALACSTAVIGSRVGGIPEIIRENETGRTFAPNCPVSLAECIRAVFAEREKTAALSRRGEQLVREKYSLNAMTQTLRDLYLAKLGIGSPSHSPKL